MLETLLRMWFRALRKDLAPGMPVSVPPISARSLVAGALGALSAAGAALGATPIASEFQVNTYTSSFQTGRPRSLIFVEAPGERLDAPYPRKGHRGTRYYDAADWPG